MAVASPAGLLSLSNELLREILDYIEADPDKLVNLDRRAYLSQESFKAPSFPSPDQAQDVSSFRLTCRRLSEIGAIHQFARVTTRFSREGLWRLNKIAGRQRIAKHVRKFSYMVPYFYVQDRGRTRERLLGLRGNLGEVDVRHLVRKIDEQEHIVGSGEDAITLQRAFSAFTSLQHVQILRVQDWEDGALLGYIRQSADLQSAIDLNWAPACSHSSMTLGTALLDSSSPCSRFSSPMLSTQSAVGLAARPPNLLSKLFQRLTSLELHFDDPTDLDARMMELSSLFRMTFTAAENMQAIHIGFPSHRPLELRLEDIFHYIKWDKLLAFGIQAWKLDSDEVIALVRRHRDRLRGLRLRDVHLKEGSFWKDILQVLRDEMPRLDWVSLRRIGYARKFDEQLANAGIEIDDVPGGDSESADEDDAFSRPPSDQEMDDDARSDTDTDATETSDEEGDENGPQAHELGFPQLAVSSTTRCSCNGQDPRTAEELGDDGIWVSNVQRKMWERWCVRRCIHSAPHTYAGPKMYSSTPNISHAEAS